MDWCRLCRTWVDEDHFKLPDGSLLGCGQGRMDIRYHPIQPRMGDIWLVDQCPMVVDFVNTTRLRATIPLERCNIDFPTIGAFANFVMGNFILMGFGGSPASLIHTAEEKQFPRADEEGWAVLGMKPSSKLSRRYCETVFAQNVVP